LSDLNSSYRRHITGRIRRKLAQGAGLPLLFPRFEVLFDYEPQPPGSSREARTSEDSVCPANVSLRVGQRLPYHTGEEWLTHLRPSVPTFYLLTSPSQGGPADALANAVAEQLGLPVVTGQSAAVPEYHVALVRPDDMVAALVELRTPGIAATLVEAGRMALQGRQIEGIDAGVRA
jgi:hypothetical protein